MLGVVKLGDPAALFLRGPVMLICTLSVHRPAFGISVVCLRPRALRFLTLELCSLSKGRGATGMGFQGSLCGWQREENLGNAT